MHHDQFTLPPLHYGSDESPGLGVCVSLLMQQKGAKSQEEVMSKAGSEGIRPAAPPRVYLIICEDQQCSRMRKGRDLAPRSTGEDGLIGSVTSPRTHPPLNTPESPEAH